MSRVLVSAERGCPRTALSHAAALAGRDGEVVFATVLVVPLAQPLGATLDRAVQEACGDLEAAERAVAGTAFDSRLVRARSFAEGILETVAAERFDVIVLESPRGVHCSGAGRGQVEAVLEKAEPTVVVVRPASADHPRRQAALV